MPVPLLGKIRDNIGRYFLRKEILRVNHSPAMISLANARSIGIVFNSDSKENVELVKKYVDYLAALGKKVTVLGNISAKDIIENVSWWAGQNYITRKELNWYFQPEKRIIDNFVRGDYDLLLDLNVSDTIPLLFVTAHTSAKCKVGKYAEQYLNLYDVMIETDADKTLKYFLRNVDKYMESINKGQNITGSTEPNRVEAVKENQ